MPLPLTPLRLLMDFDPLRKVATATVWAGTPSHEGRIHRPKLGAEVTFAFFGLPCTGRVIDVTQTLEGGMTGDISYEIKVIVRLTSVGEQRFDAPAAVARRALSEVPKKLMPARKRLPAPR